MQVHIPAAQRTYHTARMSTPPTTLGHAREPTQDKPQRPEAPSEHLPPTFTLKRPLQRILEPHRHSAPNLPPQRTLPTNPGQLGGACRNKSIAITLATTISGA